MMTRIPASSVPKEQYKGFARKISYIDQETSLPLKEEYFDKKDKLVRVFRAESIELMDGISTITKRLIENSKKPLKLRLRGNAQETNPLLTLLNRLSSTTVDRRNPRPCDFS